MSKTYLTIQLDGKDVGLKFNMGAYDVLADPEVLDSLVKDNATKNVSVLVYAGLIGNALAKKEDPGSIRIDDVRNMVKVLDRDELEELGVMLNDFVLIAYNLKKETASIEGSGDTQRQALNVA